MNNPWQEEHRQREGAFQDSQAIADAVVANEYSGAPKPIPCPGEGCEGTAFYKATIGAMKCTTCGGLCDSSGRPY